VTIKADVIRVYEIFENKAELCNHVLRSLPAWFGIESAIVDYVNDIAPMPMLAADFGDNLKVALRTEMISSEPPRLIN